ncbi:MAG: DUF1553 domain-containing protein, partial [Planctomycetales bacterium]|nr:DUF1553 domain-containing protein [Planctomycetales bacterium]
MVNRIWQHHFGQGIVATPSNFGTRGAKPTHPELLDWLATEFVRNGWSIKHLHRLILTSRSYRLSSQHDEHNASIDPGANYIWRFNRHRLDAESIRDSLLAISGQLDMARPYEHPFPPITEWTYTQHSQFRDFYPSNHRSVYLMTTRLQRHPFLSLFDGPNTNVTTDLRRSSIVPSQALFLMNDPQMQEYATAFANRLLESEPRDRISLAYQLVYQREPTRAEIKKVETFLAYYSSSSDEESALNALCRSLLSSHETFYVE